MAVDAHEDHVGEGLTLPVLGAAIELMGRTLHPVYPATEVQPRYWFEIGG